MSGFEEFARCSYACRLAPRCNEVPEGFLALRDSPDFTTEFREAAMQSEYMMSWTATYIAMQRGRRSYRLDVSHHLILVEVRPP